MRLLAKADNPAAIAPVVERHSLSRAENELLIEVKAAAVNPSDVKAATGLMAYAVDPVDLVRRAAAYVDRILKGANPGELPVQQPSKYELSINLKTAKALSLEVSTNMLALADEVIE